MSRVTLKQVAERAGVAHTTVSRVLTGKWNESVKPETRERILQAAADMGYRPHLGARMMVTGRSYSVAYIGASLSPHTSTMLTVARNYLSVRGLSLQIHLVDRDQPERDLSELHADGAILHDFEDRIAERAGSALAGMPIVCAGHYYGRTFDHVAIDLAQATKEAIGDMVSAGCERIVHFTDQISPASGDSRLLAYMEAVMGAGQTPRWEQMEETPEATYAAATRLLREPNPPDGIFCRNDSMALAALRAAHDLNRRVPQDLLILGCDNIVETAYTVPSLTTIAQPFEEAISRSVEFLLNRIETPDTPRQIAHLGATVVRRESTRR